MTIHAVISHDARDGSRPVPLFDLTAHEPATLHVAETLGAGRPQAAR